MKKLIGLLIFVLIVAGAIFLLIPDEVEEKDTKKNVSDEKDDSKSQYKLNTTEKYNICMNQYDQVAGECLAYQTGNLTYCNVYEDINMQYWCKARAEGNSSYCYLMDDSVTYFNDSYYRFVTCIAETASEVEECEVIKESEYKKREYDECVAYVTQNTSYCDRFKEEEHRKRKIDCYATINKNASACYEQKGFKRKWDCLMRLSEDDPELCKKYHEAFCKEFFKP
ncbi:MAG: hypothetical protein ACQER9_03035 [Nanobdellota archaeon]